MKIFKNSFTVEWGHCDYAGIVYYPNFYTWFDQSFERMFKSMGFPYTVLPERYGILGFPLLETGTNYKNACKLGDEVTMESWVDEHDEKTFLVKHRLLHKDGRLALEGFERRITVARSPEKKAGIKAVATPAELVAMFQAG